MITADPNVFPTNIKDKLKVRIKTLDSKLLVVNRPLKPTDGNQAIGIFPASWEPELDSLEIKGAPLGQQHPTLQRYLIVIQAFCKNMNEEKGIAEHETLSALIRGMLYHDATLRLQLTSLVWTNGTRSERARRWGVINQRFVANELGGEWLYLSSLDLWLETETT